MSGVELIKVKSQDDGMRLNRWFLKYYPALSLGHFQKLLRTKQIKVDGKRAEAGLKLAAGQEVRVPPLNLDETEAKRKNEVSKKDAEFIISLVIYKDKNILVLNKPSGLAVQGGTNTTRHIDGMLGALKFEYEEAPKLVHRIDKDTSGILVLARDRKMPNCSPRHFARGICTKLIWRWCAIVRPRRKGRLRQIWKKRAKSRSFAKTAKKRLPIIRY